MAEVSRKRELPEGGGLLEVDFEDFTMPFQKNRESSSIESCFQDMAVGAGGAGRQEGQAKN